MTITWINCADKMPPVGGKCIIRHRGISPFIDYIRPDINAFHLLINDVEWTPYTEEAWSELNKVQ